MTSRLDENPVPRRTARDVAGDVALLIPNVVKLLTRLARDPRVPIRRKAFAAAALLYVVSPIDLVPDFVVGLGQFDDVVVAALAVNHLIVGAGRDIVTEHWDGSEDSLDLVLSVAEWGAEIVPGPLRRILPG